MYVWSPSPYQILWDLQLMHDNDPMRVSEETYESIIKEKPLKDDEIKEIEGNEEYKKVARIFGANLKKIDDNFQKWKMERKFTFRSNSKYVATHTGIRNAWCNGGVGKISFYDVQMYDDGMVYIGNGQMFDPGYCEGISDDGRIETMDEWDVLYPPDYIITGTRANPMKFII